jgi:hypothetical protein
VLTKRGRNRVKGAKLKMTNAQQKLSNLEKTLSFMFQTTIEIAIRGLNDFTLCVPGKDKNEAVVKWLDKGAKNIVVNYDEELNETFIYFTGK